MRPPFFLFALPKRKNAPRRQTKLVSHRFHGYCRSRESYASTPSVFLFNFKAKALKLRGQTAERASFYQKKLTPLRFRQA